MTVALFQTLTGLLCCCVSDWSIVVVAVTSLLLLRAVTVVVLLFQMTEMEIPRSRAERCLREHHGDVVRALVTLTE